MSDAAFYLEVLKDAQALVDQFGRGCILRHPAATTPDATKPWEQTAGDPTDVPLNAAFTKYDRKMINGTSIKSSDEKVILCWNAAITWEVSTSDLLIDNEINVGRQYIIVDADIICPGPTTVVYQLQVRRG
jgi:hypothetical protein